MIRRSLFLGLTLVLVVALVTLIIRGRRLEKQQIGRIVEVVQKSKPTPTRALSPPDLEIVQSKMQLEREAGRKGPLRTARHQIELRNSGSVPYAATQLRFAYLDRGGKVLDTRTHTVAQGILPGAILKVTDIVVSDLPSAVANCRASIDYADFGPAPPQTSHFPGPD